MSNGTDDCIVLPVSSTVTVNKVLPRKVAQAVVVPTTFVSRSLVRDVGRELPRA